MNKNKEHEVYINPCLHRSRALRAMLPVMLSKRAGTVSIRPFQSGPDKKAR